MEKAPQNTPTSAVETASGPMALLGRLGRMIVFFLTAGFAYPNVWVEGMDISGMQKINEGDMYTKKKK